MRGDGQRQRLPSVGNSFDQALHGLLRASRCMLAALPKTFKRRDPIGVTCLRNLGGIAREVCEVHSKAWQRVANVLKCCVAAIKTA